VRSPQHWCCGAKGRSAGQDARHHGSLKEIKWKSCHFTLVDLYRDRFAKEIKAGGLQGLASKMEELSR
jgi:hypothetical protein